MDPEAARAYLREMALESVVNRDEEAQEAIRQVWPLVSSGGARTSLLVNVASRLVAVDDVPTVIPKERTASPAEEYILERLREYDPESGIVKVALRLPTPDKDPSDPRFSVAKMANRLGMKVDEFRSICRRLADLGLVEVDEDWSNHPNAKERYTVVGVGGSIHA